MLLILLFLNAAGATSVCDSFGQHPISKVFHPLYPMCFENLRGKRDAFCTTNLNGFNKTQLDQTFEIAYKSSGVVYKCSKEAGTVKAVLQNCRTPTGAFVEEGRTVAYNEQGDSIYCSEAASNSTSRPPLIEFNNREVCVEEGGEERVIAVEQKASNGEIECIGDGKSKATMYRLGCNTTAGFIKIGSVKSVDGKLITCYDEPRKDAPEAGKYCVVGSSMVKEGELFSKDDGVTAAQWYRCGSSKNGANGLVEFLGCTSRKLYDPYVNPFIYYKGEVIKEYKFCDTFGLKYEMSSWLRVLISSSVGHYYFCENDEGRPKTKFRGCFKRNWYYMTALNLTCQEENEEKKCIRPMKEWDNKRNRGFGSRIWKD